MKNFETILAENKIHIFSKKYPTRLEITSFLNENHGWNVWNELKDSEKISLYIEFFNQFFSSVAYDKELYRIILNDKYTFNINYSNEFKVAFFLKMRTDKISHLKHKAEKPIDININIKNVNVLEKKIQTYCDWLDGYSVFAEEKINELTAFAKDTIKYKEDIEKTLVNEFPEGVNYLSNGGTSFYPHKNIRIEVDAETRKIIPELDIKNMPLEKQLKLINYAMELM